VNGFVKGFYGYSLVSEQGKSSVRGLCNGDHIFNILRLMW